MSSMRRRLLLVEPDPAFRNQLAITAASVAQVAASETFEAARALLMRSAFDIIVTNLQLRAYNGLHLVFLAARPSADPRSVVYSARRDAGIGREVQQAHAFYETAADIALALPAYVNSTLPDRDRRDPAACDRRQKARGGRRCRDLPLAPGLVGV
jgi:ActR/RegA family two-component response regulator